MKFFFLLMGIFILMTSEHPVFGQSRLINRTEIDLMINNEQGLEIARVPKGASFDLPPLKSQLMIGITGNIGGEKVYGYIENTNSETCHVIQGPIEEGYSTYRFFSFRVEKKPCSEVKSF